jgi:hypothetical protein
VGFRGCGVSGLRGVSATVGIPGSRPAIMRVSVVADRLVTVMVERSCRWGVRAMRCGYRLPDWGARAVGFRRASWVGGVFRLRRLRYRLRDLGWMVFRAPAVFGFC